MAKHCEICGKAPVLGNQVTIRGKAKYLGGVGTKVTGISRRQFKPNLQRVRITTPGGTNTSIRVCTQCIRSVRHYQADSQRPVQASRGLLRGQSRRLIHAAPGRSLRRGNVGRRPIVFRQSFRRRAFR